MKGLGVSSGQVRQQQSQQGPVLWLRCARPCSSLGAGKWAIAWHRQSFAPLGLFRGVGTALSFVPVEVYQRDSWRACSITGKLQLVLFSCLALPGLKFLGLLCFPAHPCTSEHISVLLRTAAGQGSMCSGLGSICYFVRDLTRLKPKPCQRVADVFPLLTRHILEGAHRAALPAWRCQLHCTRSALRG